VRNAIFDKIGVVAFLTEERPLHYIAIFFLSGIQLERFLTYRASQNIYKVSFHLSLLQKAFLTG